jgi:hypothetical protein
MTQLPSYQTQFNKITEAYIKGEIQPYNESFCFCGTLSNGSCWYEADMYPEKHVYSYKQYDMMEDALLRETIENESHPLFEDYLFSGMCAALEVLKQIHIERGQVIDDAPVFIKRKELNIIP